MADIFYAHRTRPLRLSALSVVWIASDQFKQDEIDKISEDTIAHMSKDGLRVLNPILNDKRVTDWMRKVGIKWKTPHNWIVMHQGELIEFYWMSYGDKDPVFISDLFKKIMNMKGGSLPPDFTYRVAYDEYTFFGSLAALREITKLYPA